MSFTDLLRQLLREHPEGMTPQQLRDAITAGYPTYYASGLGHGLSARSGAVERHFYSEAEMNTRKRTKYVHEGKYVAEVDVELLEDETEWSPYLSVDDAYRLDEVRIALRRGDIAAAANLARIFKLEPVASSS